jgi:hypothetical protein
MALGATVSTYTTQTVISSSATNTNLSNINAVETPTFTTVKQTAGTQETGYCGFQQNNDATGGNSGIGVNFKTTMSNGPTSVTLTLITHTNCSGETAGTLRASGFFYQSGATANGNVVSISTYTTVGN